MRPCTSLQSLQIMQNLPNSSKAHTEDRNIYRKVTLDSDRACCHLRDAVKRFHQRLYLLVLLCCRQQIVGANIHIWPRLAFLIAHWSIIICRLYTRNFTRFKTWKLRWTYCWKCQKCLIEKTIKSVTSTWVPNQVSQLNGLIQAVYKTSFIWTY